MQVVGILFLDSDDYLLENSLNSLEKILKKTLSRCNLESYYSK